MIKTYPKLPFDSLPTPTPRGIKLLFVLTFTFYWFCLNHSSAVDLNIAQDAYGLGMGGAVAAIAAGTQAVPYNPAGIARANLPSVQGGMGFWPGPSNFDLSLGGLYPLNDGTVFGFNLYSDFPQDSSSCAAYVGSFAFPLDASRDFLFGMTLKYMALGQDLFGTQINGRGLGFDMGLSYDLRDPKGTRASFALVIQNVDTQLRFDDDSEETMPRSFTLGASYQEIQDTRLEMDYLFYDQVLETTGQGDRLRIGAERLFQDKNISVRAGFDGLINSDGIFTLGAGYQPVPHYEFDYALQLPVNGGPVGNYLNFIYRFETGAPEKKLPVAASTPFIPTPSGAASADIDLSRSVVPIEGNPTGSPVVEIPVVIPPATGTPKRPLTIRVNPVAFSPSARPKAVTITFPGDQSPDIRRWVLSVETQDKKSIRTFSGTGPLPPFLGWEGLDDEAHQVPDGLYQLHLRTIDPNGSLLSDDLQSVSVVAPRARFGIQTDSPFLSFRKGAHRSSFTFKVNPGGPRQVAHWNFEVSEAFTNRVVYQAQGLNVLPESLKWNGKNTGKEPVPDGTYVCFLSAEDKSGTPLKSAALQVMVQTAPPVVDLKAPGHFIDPTQPIHLNLDLNAADPVGIKSWTLLLEDSDLEQPLKVFKGDGPPPDSVAWDGLDDSAQPIPAGSFLIATLHAVDKAGNDGESLPFSLQWDVKGAGEGGSLSLNLTTVYFDPQGVELNEAGTKEIETAAASIKPYLKKSLLVVRGFCAGSETGDLVELSHDRARKVADWMTQKLQLPEGSVYAVGMGDQSPLAGNSLTPVPDEKRREAVLTVITSSP